MGLKDYQNKRDFNLTKEPSGKEQKHKKNHALEFVVQKHQATSLHYDLRLELNGVLKSWAIPKGPSLNPEDKRLAIQVEDHPFEYRTFEGVIPEGSYGAGDVIVWDAGTYEVSGTEGQKDSEAKIATDLEKGHLDIILHGHKLNGEFVLIRTRGVESNQWLLMKKKDEFASQTDITKKDRSILSDRPVVLKKSSRTLKKKANDLKEKSPNDSLIKIGKKAKMPASCKPMLATLVDEPFDDENWIFELKWDGFRTMALLHDHKVKLISRNGLSFNLRYPAIADELKKLTVDACLDGEIVVVDDQGRPSFQFMQNYHRQSKGHLIYYIFDLLYLNGRDLRNIPLIKRKELLKSILPEENPKIKFCDHILKKGKSVFKQVAKKGLEGIIAKRLESPYMEGKRSKNWLKIKTHLRQEAVICGFTPPKGSREYFGALLLGVYIDKTLTYVGHTGTGFDSQKLANIYARLSPLIQPNCPFKTKPKTRSSVTWVKPELICEISFTEWTEEGSMRHAVFVDFRDDKKPKDVIKEKEVSAKELIKKEKKTKILNSKNSAAVSKKNAIPNELEFSNLDKVFWPKEGYTKGDLIEYYRSVSKLILPHLVQRPESLRRFPNGISAPGFFQKEATHAPSWINTISIHHHENREVNYYLIEKEKDLLYLVNLGCIDFNPFLSRIQSLEYPDFLVIDLDPEDINFEKVIEVALCVHEVLEKWDVTHVCKTSGKRGMHIYIPLQAKYKYEEAANFGKLIAYIVHEQMPDITSVERSPKDRQKKVYLDYLQNNFGQTVVAPYSVRPSPAATVSTPLKWSEVKPGLSPEDFTMKNVLTRFKKVGDLFKPVLGKGVDIPKILKKIN
jgi:bifunctional non-homologous end joining protein LigD